MEPTGVPSHRSFLTLRTATILPIRSAVMPLLCAVNVSRDGIMFFGAKKCHGRLHQTFHESDHDPSSARTNVPQARASLLFPCVSSGDVTCVVGKGSPSSSCWW